jgi:hypothetical protein
VRVSKISTTRKALEQDVDITMVGGDVMYPAVVTDTQSDMWIAFSSSSTSQFASAEVAEAPGGTIGATIGGIIYKTGTGSINYSSCTSPPAASATISERSSIRPARDWAYGRRPSLGCLAAGGAHSWARSRLDRSSSGSCSPTIGLRLRNADAIDAHRPPGT